MRRPSRSRVWPLVLLEGWRNTRTPSRSRSSTSSGVGPGAPRSWADDERSRNPKTTRWHFVDIPLAVDTYDPGRDCALHPDEGDCAIAAIVREQLIVGCAARPQAERARALKFLVHFVGDLHQPLHAIKEKRSGNDVPVTVVKAGSTFERVAENRLPDTFTASPAVSNGRMYLRGWNTLYAIVAPAK